MDTIVDGTVGKHFVIMIKKRAWSRVRLKFMQGARYQRLPKKS